MKFITLALLTGALSFAKADTNGKCLALAFSSGDESAAYQAGVLSGITNSTQLQPSDYAYDTVSGIQGGALNAVLLSSFPKGQEKEAAARMQTFWDDATKAQLYKDWLGGLTQGLLYEGGLYNSKPMQTFLKNEFSTTTINRGLDLGIVDIKDG
jgi:predicted acylesterase/phospholipase RssA